MYVFMCVCVAACEYAISLLMFNFISKSFAAPTREQSSWTFHIYAYAMGFCAHTHIPEFLKTGLAKIRTHSTTWQLNTIKFVKKADKKPKLMVPRNIPTKF